MSVLGALFLLPAGIGIVYLCLAAVMVARLSLRRAPTVAAVPSVTILKPLHGAEPGLFENLASFARQHHAAPVQIVLGVQNPADPAIAVARELQAAYPALLIDLVIDGRQHGTNRKVSNLVNMMGAARHEVLVLADSDMRVGPTYLAGLVAELARPGVGAVTCPYHGLPVGHLWSKLSGLGIDTHFLPGVALGSGLGAAEPCMGSTIALRRDTLDRIGGLPALADALADDYELGARVRALGLSIALTPFTIGHVCPERSLGELARQELRWQRTVRQVAPAGHLGSVLTHPLPFAIAALAVDPGPVAAGILLTALAARVGLCLAVERGFSLRTHPYWLVPARDLLSFALFVASFLGRGVSWRGYRYEVARSGALIPKTRPDPL
ncbi:bacteriohopanetetrol glucosamine biosynthesis glycosyltransferase HpnI [uncultured Enterovirga sp.]|uniref:bacteriohopanetetrol glucosamine biosynthesis glycosyltransferase HpnI n=1 Tax=uncultured Enterovirga sp. TaxID=2026352 RepID=UPI0035CBFC7A